MSNFMQGMLKCMDNMHVQQAMFKSILHMWCGQHMNTENVQVIVQTFSTCTEYCHSTVVRYAETMADT